jgi:hypothetical protein
MIETTTIHLSTIDRESVRALVASELGYQKQAMAEGQNVHQVVLDRQDVMHAYMATLDEATLEKFMTFYEQEMTASTQTLLDEAAALNAATANRQIQTATDSANVGVWISLIAFFAFIFFIIQLLR